MVRWDSGDGISSPQSEEDRVRRRREIARGGGYLETRPETCAEAREREVLGCYANAWVLALRREDALKQRIEESLAAQVAKKGR
jgi:hypothetical protein